MHQFLKHPLEVGERIGTVAAHLFDEGIDDRAAPAGVLPADEHPVLVTEFGRTDGVFGEVVVPLDPAVHEAGFEVWRLFDGVVERLVKAAAGRDSAEADHPPHEFAEMVEGFSGFEPAGALALERTGTFFPEAGLNLVDGADEQQDARANARKLRAGFLELAGDVGKAGNGDEGLLGVPAGRRSQRRRSQPRLVR